MPTTWKPVIIRAESGWNAGITNDSILDERTHAVVLREKVDTQSPRDRKFLLRWSAERAARHAAKVANRAEAHAEPAAEQDHRGLIFV